MNIQTAKILGVIVLSFLAAQIPLRGTAGESKYLAEARSAAEDDRHAEAIAFYLQAVGRDSVDSAEVALELGHQYTWADKPDLAQPWYELFLQKHPGNIDGILGLARALSWQDKLADSEKFYASVLAKRPLNAEARLGLAQVKNWSGKHRSAAGIYRELILTDPFSTEAAAGMASAENWMGLPYRALARLENSRRNEEITRLSAEIKESLRPSMELGFSMTLDSDDIEVAKTGMEIKTHTKSISRIGSGFYYKEITQTGFPAIRQQEAVLTLTEQFSPSIALTFAPGFERSRSDALFAHVGSIWAGHFDVFLIDTYLTLTPIDWLRIDTGYAQTTLDIPLSLFKGIQARTTNLGVDWRLTHKLTAFANASLAHLSDSNNKLNLNQRFEWISPLSIPVSWKNGFKFAVGYEYFHFTRLLANGYYNPRDYLNVYNDTYFMSAVGRRAAVTIRGRLSLERENNTETVLVGGFESKIEINPIRTISVTAGYHNSRSRLDSSSGYRLSGFFINMDYRF